MTTPSMKRVEVRTGEIVLVDAPVPRPLPDEVQVETTVTGVCGSDTHASHGRHPFVPLPYRPGHEVVGVIREVGALVTGLAVGDRVTVEPTLPCWDCKMCATGRSNICENLRFFGCGYEQGGMADFFTIPADRIHRIPADLDDFQAALIEPLATPVHAVRLSGGVRDKAVVVIGSGTIGLMVVAAAKHAGARKIVVTDRLPGKLAKAVAVGADATVLATVEDPVAVILAELGESADVVFDCVAIQSTMDQALKLAVKGGTVMVVGVPQRDVVVSLPQVQDLQMRIQGSATYLPEDYAVAMSIIAAGGVTVENFITKRFPLQEVAQAFAASSSGKEVKVILTARSDR